VENTPRIQGLKGYEPGLRVRGMRELRIILISHEKYAWAIIMRFGMENANECATPMDTKEDWMINKQDIL